MDNSLKNSILQLKSQGKSYNEIAEILNCSKGTISYHCSEKTKEKVKRNRVVFALANVAKIKNAHGGKCKLCGYNKCFNALEFHHLKPELKEDSIMRLLRCFSYKKALEESYKCILVCANCHREIHANLIDNSKLAASLGIEPN